jgi:hypothetical protein
VHHDRLLECAEAARADYLVIGNTKHFPSTFKHTAIRLERNLCATADTRLSINLAAEIDLSDIKTLVCSRGLLAH